jgi:hypothetical protein
MFDDGLNSTSIPWGKQSKSMSKMTQIEKMHDNMAEK